MEFIFVLYALCVIGILAIIPRVYRYYVIRRKLRNIPQLDSIPFIGDAFLLMKQTEYGKNFYKIHYLF